MEEKALGFFIDLVKSDRTEKIKAGDLVEVNIEDNKYRKTTEEYSKYIIGVCTEEEKPVEKTINYYINGMPTNSVAYQDKVKVCISGLAKVNVLDHVNIGDLLVSSEEPGKARKARYEADNYNHGKILGKVIQYTDKEDQVIAMISIS